MKQMKNFTLSLVAFLGLSFGAIAQLTYDQKSDTLILENGVENKAEITIYNNDAADYDISWTLISSTLKDNDGSGNFWLMQFCECNNCYTNDFNPLPTSGVCNMPMAGGTNLKWYLTVNPNGQAFADGEWIIEVNNTTLKQRDTLSYYVMNPNSTTNLTQEVGVTAYPNPAQDQLTIKYNAQAAMVSDVVVYNVVGAVVKTVSVSNQNGLVNVNTADLQNGLYIYELRSNNAAIATQKFNVLR
jgi:hypothetical protein